jgi:hypothetical protein
MRSRILAVAGISAAALAAATAFAGTAGAHSAPGAMVHGHAAVSHASVTKGSCYSNMADDAADGVLSQNFTDSGFDIYDAAGAADFAKGKKCKSITKVTTVGQYFNGAGPADSVNVLFYKGGGSTPGGVTKEYDALSYTDSTGLGSLGTTIPKTKGKHGGWVSVVANMAFASGGEWGWEISTDQPGNPDVWENPGGGFGVCSSWDTNVDCIGVAGDYMVTLAK